MGIGITPKKEDFCIYMTYSKKESSKNISSKKISGKSSVKERPVILITNDDGVTAPGILNLVEAVKDLGKIVVVAPDKPQSEIGRASCRERVLRRV